MRIEAATSVLVAGITKCPKRKKKRSAPVVLQRAVIETLVEVKYLWESEMKRSKMLEKK
jgi:hypothetical protein